jgi:hypothetical protein
MSSKDTDLFARLNALRPTPISLDKNRTVLPSTPQSDPSALKSLHDPLDQEALELGPDTDPILDLAARFQKLGDPSTRKANKPVRARVPVKAISEGVGGDDVEIQFGRRPSGEEDEDDRTLEELLKELGGGPQEWGVDAEEERNVGRMVEDIRRILPDVISRDIEQDTNKKLPGDTSKLGPQPGLIKLEEEDNREQDAIDEQEADDYIAKVLAELELEKNESKPERTSNGDGSGDEEENTSMSEPKRAPVPEDDPIFDLPNAPTAQLVTPPSPSDFNAATTVDDALTARMNALSLPSAPSFVPAKKPIKVSKNKSNLPKYTDEEIDSWCIICNEDATVRCLGCDGDLYCKTCWKEGHIGPEAGYEEKKHKWTKYEYKSNKSGT